MKYFKLFVFVLLASLPLAVFAQTQDTSFIPLTQNTPFLEGAGDASTLPVFLNNLYKICIGLAAVIAVLQIMRAGVMYMGGDSVTEKKEAKNLIGLAIGGLILVLSPVIVFGIINPDILSLKIDGIEKLRIADTTAPAAEVCTPACTDGKVCTNGACAAPAPGGTCSTLANGAAVGTSALQACCSAQAGCKVQVPTGSSTATPTCSCTAPVAVRYGWHGVFVKTADESGRATQQRGPFDTKAACETSLRDWPASQGLSSTGEFSCNCSKPLSEQSGCSF